MLSLSLAGAALVLLALAQLLAPRIAANTISSRVGRYGSVENVSVTAWPAIELLWGRADSVRVSARRLALQPAQAAALLSEADGVARLDLSAERLQVGPLALSDARLHKRGKELSAVADAADADVKAALPGGLRVRLLRSEGGRVEVRASGSLFGVQETVAAVAEARAGKLIAHPLVLLLEGFSLTLFSDPRIAVEAVGARELSPHPPSYRLSMRARLR